MRITGSAVNCRHGSPELERISPCWLNHTVLGTRLPCMAYCTKDWMTGKLAILSFRLGSRIRDARSSHPFAYGKPPPAGGPANLPRPPAAKPSGRDLMRVEVQFISRSGFRSHRTTQRDSSLHRLLTGHVGQRRPFSSRPISLHASRSEQAVELRKAGRLRIPRFFISGANSSGMLEAGSGRLQRRVRFTSLERVTRAMPIAAFPSTQQ